MPGAPLLAADLGADRKTIDAALRLLEGEGLLEAQGAGKRRVPEDVSLVCTDADPSFDWCQPPISHIRWDIDPVVRRVVRWVGNVSAGKPDLRQTLTPAEFVPGGTIGPVAK